MNAAISANLDYTFYMKEVQHTFQKSLPSLRDTFWLFPRVPIIAHLHYFYAFRNADKAGAVGADLFCNALQQTWANKQIEQNSTSHRTSFKVLNVRDAFFSLTSMKSFIFANRDHLYTGI